MNFCYFCNDEENLRFFHGFILCVECQDKFRSIIVQINDEKQKEENMRGLRVV